MAETVFHCARVPAGATCSVELHGERDHVVDAAKQHLASHGHENNAQLDKDVTRAVDDQDYDSWGS